MEFESMTLCLVKKFPQLPRYASRYKSKAQLLLTQQHIHRFMQYRLYLKRFSISPGDEGVALRPFVDLFLNEP